MKRQLNAVIVAAICLAAASTAFGLGFRNPDQGARATGQGEAFVAQADDASAIYYNPAGLTQVKGTQVTSGMYLNFPDVTFRPLAGGGDMKARDDMYMLPHLYAASDFGLSNWRFGLGFNVPFGNTMTWGANLSTVPGIQLSSIVDKSTMAVYSISPTVAYQINDQLSIGGGVNIYYGDLMSRFKYSPLATPNADFEFRGDDLTAGVTLGMLWKPNWQHSVGVVWRSPFTMNFDGFAYVHNPTPGTPPDPGPSRANFQMEFPQSVAIGYAFRPIKKLKLEVDIEWTNWDTLNTCTLSSPNPWVAGDPRATVAYNWKDSFFYEFGVEYELNEQWQIRAGYIFSENTVPSNTFGPNLPDSDRHIFSGGISFTTKRFTVNAAYQYSRSTNRTVVGSPLGYSDGNWSSDGHAVSITSTMRF